MTVRGLAFCACLLAWPAFAQDDAPEKILRPPGGCEGRNPMYCEEEAPAPPEEASEAPEEEPERKQSRNPDNPSRNPHRRPPSSTP